MSYQYSYLGHIVTIVVEPCHIDAPLTHLPPQEKPFSLDHRYFSHKMNTEPTPYIVRGCDQVIQFFGTVNVIGASFGVQ